MAGSMSTRPAGTVLKVILVLIGVFAGWSAASYAFLYFTRIGIASDTATGYSIILWLAVIGASGLVAFKAKIRKVTPTPKAN